MVFSHEITDTYDIIGEIGKGGSGTVYKAYHKRLRKTVVLKKQHDSIRGLVNERTETDTLKNLRHSNLPQVLDFIITADAVYTVMDFIPGQSVKEILDQKHKMTEPEVIKYAQQLCDALVYLHNSNPPVIHGDIKPDNIMITPDGDVCLIDFNISSALGAANSYAFGYTLGYAAPEQKRSFEYERDRIKRISTRPIEATVLLNPEDFDEASRKDSQGSNAPISSQGMTVEEKQEIGILYDKRSDIYSFGATLYHMITGIKPASDPDKIVPVLEIYPLLNRGLADIITKSMYASPEERFQSFDEIKKILNNIRKYDLKYKAKVTRRIVIGAISAVVIGTIVAVMLINIKKTGAANYSEGLDEALELYNSADYEGSIGVIEEKLIDKFYFDLDKKYRSSTYYLRGNDWFGLERYDYAVEDYNAAIEYDEDNAMIYRDKAIALARLKEHDEAVEVLAKAEQKGLSIADLKLVNAEIEDSINNKTQAIALYKECIVAADDDQTKARASLLCSKLFDEHDEKQLNEAISMLSDASMLNSSYQAGILEKLAQKYINAAQYTGDTTYYLEAAKVFDRIVDKGWDTYNTHNNLAIIYDQTDDLKSAEAELQFMLERYGDNYNTYKRLAFLEIEKQNVVISNDRDYSAFYSYYDWAKSLYENRSDSKTDAEMNVLEELSIQIE